MGKHERLGVGIAVTGVAHFIAPKLFVPITKGAFPEDTGKWIKRNGASETAIGVAIAAPATRKLGFAGLGVYSAWLGWRGARALR
ncbi:MAG: hypothetical protein HZB14_09925 [Actinobacteria bacterium]|nr:hypothetical protein [Actinomycetota bacterium]